MSLDLDKACGIDVHRDMFVATILEKDDSLLRAEFCTTGDGLYQLRDWIVENNCKEVAFESTGVYWRQLYNVLSSGLNVIVANPGKIKKPPGSKNKKTDKIDSKWIATLRLAGMIPASRVFLGDQYNLRELTRYREILVRVVGQFKNRSHRVLEVCCIKIGSVLSDVFGTNGRKMLQELIQGKGVEEILNGIKSKRVKKKEEQLRRALSMGLDETSRLLLQNCLTWIKNFEEEIERIDSEIMRMLVSRKEDLKILMSIPGMGFVSSATILAEIGDITDFDTPEKLASWCGLVPGVYQSAGKLVTGRITKQGSKHVRRMLVQVAHVINKMDNRLSKFFHRIEERKGSKKAAVALARKLLCIIHHLLSHKENYEEPTVKPKQIRLPTVAESSPIPSIEEMIKLIRETGRTVSDLPDHPEKLKRRRKSRTSGGT